MSASLRRPEPGSIPTGPGVYRFSDAHGRTIYVGKAKSLRARLSSYFVDGRTLHPRTRAMLDAAHDVDWTVVRTEVEALQLEYSWIKEFDPRFNVKYRDDKSYPYLAVTLGEEYPRAQVMRGRRRKGTRSFGPYAHAWAIRDTLDLLLRVFPVRTCSNGVFRSARQSGRPCLLGYIDRCAAPCVGRVDADEHRRIAEDLCTFLAGATGPFLADRRRRMEQAAEELDFERAARLRDDLRALERAMESSTVVLPDGTDVDIVGLHGDELEAAVQVFFVRDGRVRGRRGWVSDRVEDVDDAGLVEQFLLQIYGAAEVEDLPREILVPTQPADAAVIEWLAERRQGPVSVRVPRRGAKASLLGTVAANAQETLRQHRMRRTSDLTARSRALQDLQDALDLPEPPLRIECIDIAHLQGSDAVGALVVFEDGLATKAQYRRFAIGADAAGDDVASVAEVVRRRFSRYREEREARSDEDTDVRRPARFAYPPSLLVVDGGPAQAAAARRSIDELGIPGIAVVGLAKRLEEVWPADDPDPILLPRGSEGLYLLQRIRDEAHRFANTDHRRRRSGTVRGSELDGVPGLGPARRAALLRRFGSVKRLREADPDQIADVPGIGPVLAAAVHAALRRDDDAGSHAASGMPGAVNTATGEIMAP